MTIRADAKLTAINGQFCDVDAAGLLTSRAFNYGDGIFETMRLINGKLPLWSMHCQRLLRGVDILNLSISVQTIEQLLTAFCQSMSYDFCGVVKIVLARNCSGVSGYVSADQSVDCYIQYLPMPDLTSWYQSEIVLVYASGRLAANPALAGLKHLSRLDYIVAAARNMPAVTEELLFLDMHDCVIETMRHNIFYVKDNVLHTPSLAQVGVEGVMRRYILDVLVGEMGVTAEIGTVTITSLQEADELFLTNAVRGIVPVGQLGERHFTQHPIARRLAECVVSRFPC